MVTVNLCDFSVAYLHSYIRLLRFFHAADKYDQASSFGHAVNIAADTVVQRLSFVYEVIGLFRADNLQFFVGKRCFSRKARVGHTERFLFLRVVDFLNTFCLPVMRSCAVFRK